MSEVKKISKKAHVRVWARQSFTQRFSQNLETMYGLGFAYSLVPALRELYGDRPEELKAAIKRSMTTFITEPYYGQAINGIDLAMEEARANGEDIPDEMIINTRLSLMGPFAGFGDSFHWGTLRPIIRALFITLATAGSLVGIFGDWVVWISAIVIGWFSYNLGYKTGKNAVVSMLGSSMVQGIVKGASVLGMFMMGAMCSQYVKLNTAISFTSKLGDTYMLQNVFDSILPGLLPALVITGSYLYLSKKNASSIKLILAYVLIAVVGSFLHIF